MLSWLEKNRVVSSIISVIIAGVIFYFSSISNDPVPSIGFKYKAVLYHIGIFFLFCFFLMIALSKGRKKDWLFFAVLFSVFYGITDELHQHFVPGRSVSMGDFFIDVLGISFAFVLYFISIELRNGKKIVF